MELNKASDSSLPNGSGHAPKRGRGRPRGSLNKKFTTEKAPTHNARPSKKVDYFSPDVVIKKVKKRGRPKKIRIPGRPRKIPLTPEEESERLYKLSQRKRKLSKPLGRPRIHPIAEGSRVKRGRGRPPKSEAGARKQDSSNGPPRKRGRPSSTMKRKRGRPAGSGKLSVAKVSDGTPKKRGRPPGSPNKVKKIQRVEGSAKKRGRPPGSPNKLKVIKRNPDGTPRKRGRPPGTGKKVVKVVAKPAQGAPRKRGRPSGTGKVKARSGSAGAANPTGAPRRKRGRPSKVRLAVVLDKLPSDEDDDETDAPSPKQSRTSDDSSQNANDDDDCRGSDNDADPEDEDDDDDAIDCSKVNNTSENEMVGKFKKKK